jgi:hypothetical protein
MEDFKQRPENKRYFDFADAIAKRVNVVGARRGTTGRSAQDVVDRLFRSSDGDASKVTDEDIDQAFDAVDKEE